MLMLLDRQFFFFGGGDDPKFMTYIGKSGSPVHHWTSGKAWWQADKRPPT